MILVILAAFLHLLCLSASPIHETTTTTNASQHDLLKREYIIECENFDAQIGGTSIAGFRISSMQDLCINYPHGLGAFCSGEAIEFREPRNPLYFQAWMQPGGGGITSLCRRLCRCYDLAPDMPSIQNEPAGKEQASCSDYETSSEDDEEVSSGPIGPSTPQVPDTRQCREDESSMSSSAKYPRHFTCSSSFYGNPESADCEAAIKKLPDWGDSIRALRQYSELSELESDTTYFAHEIEFDSENTFSFRDKVLSPVMVSSGACKVAVMLPETPRSPTQPALVGSQAVINAAQDLRAECVDEQGSGGKFDFLWFLDGNVLIPNIIMFEKNSLMDDWMTLKTTVPISSSGSGSSKGSHQTACSGSCMDPNDCDINSNCVCATDKSVPLSSTWGQHACMYVAGAALAHVQASVVRPFTRCRGRCLSEDGEGSNSAGAANISNHGPNVSVSNQTTPSSSNSTPIHVQYHQYDAKAPQAINKPFIPLNTSITLHPTLHPTLSATGLTCPCNCTYVSASCCLSSLVWEDASKQVQMNPLPANGTVCCNATSGAWMPKKSGGVGCAAI